MAFRRENTGSQSKTSAKRLVFSSEIITIRRQNLSPQLLRSGRAVPRTTAKRAPLTVAQVHSQISNCPQGDERNREGCK